MRRAAFAALLLLAACARAPAYDAAAEERREDEPGEDPDLLVQHQRSQDRAVEEGLDRGDSCIRSASCRNPDLPPECTDDR